MGINWIPAKICVLFQEQCLLSVVPESEVSCNKLVAVCCKLSRESWTTNAANSRSITNLYFCLLIGLVICNFPFSDNSNRKWDSLLQDITHMECMTMKSKSLIGKLFVSSSPLSIEVSLVTIKFHVLFAIFRQNTGCSILCRVSYKIKLLKVSERHFKDCG